MSNLKVSLFVVYILLFLTKGVASEEDEKKDECQLPYCYEDYKKIPGGIPLKQTPQFVVLTYQGYVDEPVFELIFEQIWKPKFINPDGCRTGMTIFVSNENLMGHDTNVSYCSIHKLYTIGYELALSTDFQSEQWDSLMVDQRENLTVRSALDVDHVQGIRIAKEMPGGDSQFKALTTNGFLYDSSLFVVPKAMNETTHWPFTWDSSLNDLKFSVDSAQKGGVPEGDTYSFLWEVPNVWLVASETQKDLRQCLFIRDCLGGMRNKDDVKDKLWQMLHGRITTNRAPLMINLDLKTLKNKRIMMGLQLFLKSILHGNEEYIWVVGIQQLLEWVRAPVSIYSLQRDNRDLVCINTHKYQRCDPKYIRKDKPMTNFRIFMNVDVLWIYQTVILVVFYFALYRYDNMQTKKK